MIKQNNLFIKDLKDIKSLFENIVFYYEFFQLFCGDFDICT